ncbi:MAG TPA: extracellular solute-binding protein [Gaiellaceae bacterium]
MVVAALAVLILPAIAAARVDRSNAGATAAARTLVVQDGESGSNERVATYKLLDKAFEKAHPGVQIKHVSKTFDQLTTTLNLQLSGSSVPDVTQVNQGYGSMGLLVKAKLLRPLDGYARTDGWLKRQPASLLAMGRFTPDGKSFGRGNLYGVSATGDIVGIFYNKAKLKSLGHGVPKTFGQLQADLAAAKKAGIVPIAFGDLDKSPAIHDWQLVQNALASKAQQTSFIYGRATKFTTPANVRSLAVFQSWAKNDYFTPDFLALGYDDWVNGFAKGDALFIITGSWFNTQLQQTMGKNVGFFLPPRPKAGAAPVTTGAGGLAWAIPTKAQNPDLAAQYIDFITNKAAAELFLKRQDIPMYPLPASTVPRGTATADIINAFVQLKKGDGFVPYIDWATPSLYNTLNASLQDLLGGNATPQSVAKAADSDYAKFLKSR